MRTTPANFPRAARLLKTDEFSSVFRLRPWARSAHFVLYGRASGQPARLGVVVGKKQAPRAVTRNRVKRLVREAFRTRRMELVGWDVLIRLSGKVDRTRFPSAASGALERMLQAQIDGLVERAVREAARHARGERSGGPRAAQPSPAQPCAAVSVRRSEPGGPLSTSSDTSPREATPDRSSTDSRR